MHRTYYEAHVTLLGLPDVLEPAVVATKWKFSKIAGDPNLGEGVRCYATRQFNAALSQEAVLVALHNTAAFLGQYGEVVRKKIELVIYDDRSTLVDFTCTGHCPECTK